LYIFGVKRGSAIYLKKILATIILALVVVAGIAFVVRHTNPTDSSGRLSVVASYYPLYDFVRQVGGDKVSVTNITPSGSEPHDYEPPAKTLANAQGADVFIYNGGIMEPWTDTFLDDYKRTVIRASKGITLAPGEEHGHDQTEPETEGHEDEDIKDPHFWLDPVLAQKIVNNIREGLSKADPGNKDYYAERAAAYSAKLAQLDKDFRTGLQACVQETIVASHAAFSYVAKRYGFSVESIAGLNPEEEPSTTRLAELSDHVTKESINYVFFESLVSPRLADTIAQETGAQTLVLDPLEGLSNEDQKQGKDYVSVQRENLANLRTALACE
jgi:zinc transport system substrate-binding protein